MGTRRLAALLSVPFALSTLAGHAGAGASSKIGPQVVVALIDTGINPYSAAFRDDSALAYRHPSTYLPGYPKNTPALRLSLDLPYKEAIKKDERLWLSVRPRTLYWIPGTKIVGAISMGSGGTCSSERPPPVNGGGPCTEHVILDDQGHGTMTSSRATGTPHSLAPTARVVMIEGLGSGSVTWAADQGWIDVQSNSWLSPVPNPANPGTSGSFEEAAKKMVTIAASGNGTAYLLGVAPTPTYVLSTAAPGVILVGGHDNGKMTLWAGAPPHVVADAYSGFTAIRDSSEKMRPDPIACCTSAAAPYAAGGAAAVILEARRLLGDDTPGVHDGILAEGAKGRLKRGPLADGKFTLEEFKDVYFRTAQPRPVEGRDDGDVHWAGDPRAPELTPWGPGDNPFCLLCTTTPLAWEDIPGSDEAYALIGYGAINEHSVVLARKVLAGTERIPSRPAADQQYELDQQLRGLLY